jgi:hypothetical protein
VLCPFELLQWDATGRSARACRPGEGLNVVRVVQASKRSCRIEHCSVVGWDVGATRRVECCGCCGRRWKEVVGLDVVRSCMVEPWKGVVGLMVVKW